MDHHIRFKQVGRLDPFGFWDKSIQKAFHLLETLAATKVIKHFIIKTNAQNGFWKHQSDNTTAMSYLNMMEESRNLRTSGTIIKLEENWSSSHSMYQGAPLYWKT